MQSENGGLPHCLGLRIDSDNACDVFDGHKQCHFPRTALLNAVGTAIDPKTIVLFGETEPHMSTTSPPTPATLISLLDLEA